ncbi:hypothetical protein [Ralstonia syzygii]|uniref:hypothetical protein n=1 Tax=Ralstonia syzygii TaxID=28097 RepID=UPI001EF1353D|nr:hypothetical protein [Ralstonia syzygii]
MDKRLFNTQEAMAYLGMKRKAFDTLIAPVLKGKGVKVGTSILFERCDLDAAWETYKIGAGSERPQEKGDSSWGVQKRRASTKRPMVAGRSMPGTSAGAFASAVSRVMPKLKAT